MSDRQLDLFAGSWKYETQAAARPPPEPPAELDDPTLIAAIPTAGLPHGPALAREAGRRRLHAAVPVLQDYCRRFTGYGTERNVPEQIAALEALLAIGGADATDAVARIISRAWVQGPTLAMATKIAAALGCVLSADVVVGLLRHDEPAVRADACRLTRTPRLAETLIDLMNDLHKEVAVEAACALGRLGRAEGRGILLVALKQAPSATLIGAIASIADLDCVVALGRIAAGNTPLRMAARHALAGIEHATAARILRRLGGRDA